MKNISEFKIHCGLLVVESNLSKKKKIALLKKIENESEMKKLKVIEQNLRDKIQQYREKQFARSHFIPFNVYKSLKEDSKKCQNECKDLPKREMRLCLYKCKLQKMDEEIKLIQKHFNEICRDSRDQKKCVISAKRKINSLFAKRIWTQKAIQNMQHYIDLLNQQENKPEEEEDFEDSWEY